MLISYLAPLCVYAFVCMCMCSYYNEVCVCVTCTMSVSRLSHNHIYHYRVIGHCRSCEELDNKARLRADYSTYRLMLKDIKQTEERYSDGSNIVFLMQVSTA